MAQCATCVLRLYKSIIEEVTANVRDCFLDEGIDEQVLLEMKASWEQKLTLTRVTDHGDLLSGQQQNTQQLQQAAHQQVTSGIAGQTTATQSATGVAPAAPAVPVSSTAVNLVPVQITVPAQQAGGMAKTITIHVPSTALANGVAGAQLQTILSAPSAAQTFAMEATQAADVIQRQLNSALQRRGITVPPQLLHFNSEQLDGAAPPPGCTCSRDAAKQQTMSRRSKKGSIGWQLPPAAQQDIHEQLAERLQEHSVEDRLQTDLVESPQQDSIGRLNTDSVEQRLHPFITIDKPIIDAVVLDRLTQLQVDGGAGCLDDSSDEMSGDDEDDDEDKEEEEEKEKKYGEEEEEEEEAQDANEEPLNSADDVSDDESGEAFDTDNVVVCQYDKITRVRNKWKFNLKDGIMNLKGKDYVFLKATGEGEW